MQYASEHLDLVLQGDTRFWAKVDVPFTPGGCWTWTGAKNGDGYGSFLLTVAPHSYITTGAHRLAYEALVGGVPSGLDLDHLCRNRACVRPDHVEPVDHRTNVLRGEGLAAQTMRRPTCPKGHPYDRMEGRFRRCSICRRANRRKVA